MTFKTNKTIHQNKLHNIGIAKIAAIIAVAAIVSVASAQSISALTVPPYSSGWTGAGNNSCDDASHDKTNGHLYVYSKYCSGVGSIDSSIGKIIGQVTSGDTVEIDAEADIKATVYASSFYKAHVNTLFYPSKYLGYYHNAMNDQYGTLKRCEAISSLPFTCDGNYSASKSWSYSGTSYYPNVMAYTHATALISGAYADGDGSANGICGDCGVKNFEMTVTVT